MAFDLLADPAAAGDAVVAAGTGTGTAEAGVFVASVAPEPKLKPVAAGAALLPKLNPLDPVPLLLLGPKEKPVEVEFPTEVEEAAAGDPNVKPEKPFAGAVPDDDDPKVKPPVAVVAVELVDAGAGVDAPKLNPPDPILLLLAAALVAFFSPTKFGLSAVHAKH